jgi:5-formyltetrahydrofolate cyclo-ligase
VLVTDDEGTDQLAAKQQLRAATRAARAVLSSAERNRARAAIGELVRQWCLRELAIPARIAAFQPLASEPLPPSLLDDLVTDGYDVIVPVTGPDRDLSWHRYRPEGLVRKNRDGAAITHLDVGELGATGIASAALVLVPAFAVDGSGHRLGRGGGSYDRALPRAATGALIAAVLYDTELIDHVPTEPWDRPVTATVTPSGFRLIPGR